MIDAAAMAVQRRSPCSTPRCAMNSSGIRKASTSTRSGSGASVITARRIASRDARRADDVDLGDRGRVQREDALDALPEGDLADRERRARAAAMQPDDDPLEDLNAFLVALAHLHVHAHGVARLHAGPIRQLRLLDLVYGTHGISPSGGPERPALLLADLLRMR